MNRDQKPRRRLKIIATSVSVVLVLLAGIGGILYQRDSSQSSADFTDISENQSSFTFDFDAAPNWYEGPNNEASYAVFHNEKKQSCFSYMNYKDDDLSESDWRRDLRNRNNENYDFILDQEQTLTIKTDEGRKQYKLQQFTNQLKKGLPAPGILNALYESEAHGYIALREGYILVHGYCTPPSLMPEVISAIQAFSYDGS